MFHYTTCRQYSVCSFWTECKYAPTCRKERPVRTGQAGSSPHRLSQPFGLRVLRSSNRRHRLNYILTWSLSQTVTQELLKTPQIPSKSPNPRLLKAQLVHLWFSPRTTITRTKLSLELTPASELLKMLKYQMMEIGSCFEDEGERRAKIRGQQTQSRDSLSWQVRLTFSRR